MPFLPFVVVVLLLLFSLPFHFYFHFYYYCSIYSISTYSILTVCYWILISQRIIPYFILLQYKWSLFSQCGQCVCGGTNFIYTPAKYGPFGMLFLGIINDETENENEEENEGKRRRRSRQGRILLLYVILAIHSIQLYNYTLISIHIYSQYIFGATLEFFLPSELFLHAHNNCYYCLI